MAPRETRLSHKDKRGILCAYFLKKNLFLLPLQFIDLLNQE